MKCILSLVLIVCGILLIMYFGFVFFIFSTTDEPALVPFMVDPVIFSIGFVMLGIVMTAIGIWWCRKLSNKATL